MLIGPLGLAPVLRLDIYARVHNMPKFQSNRFTDEGVCRNLGSASWKSSFIIGFIGRIFFGRVFDILGTPKI